MIRFNNDYNRGAFDCILKALADTNTTSYPGYGEDEWCDKAEQIIKGLIGRDDSMIKFIPGATQANYVVVAAALSPVQSVIFAFIVILANRLNCWKTMPIFCLVTLMSVDLSVRSVPSKRICPDVGVSSRLRERKNVDFPQPDGPMMAITSPLFTSVLMPFNTSCSPKLLCRSFTSSITLLSFIASQSPLKFAYSVA